jgi:hypothetical protein
MDNVIWRKSTFSTVNGCVEVAFLEGGFVAVRNSTDRQAPALRFTPLEWQAFVDAVHAGQFDLP